MESKTSPKSATWRRRKTGCVVQSKSESLRTRGAHGRNPSSSTEDKMRCPSSRAETEKIKNSSSSGSVHALNRLDHTHLHGGGKFTESHHPNANITWKPSHRHIRKKCLVNIWAPCDLVSWHTKWIVAVAAPLTAEPLLTCCLVLNCPVVPTVFSPTFTEWLQSRRLLPSLSAWVRTALVPTPSRSFTFLLRAFNFITSF